MAEKNYLTPDEQMLWSYLDDKGIIDSELADMVFPDLPEDKRDKLLYGLHKKGYINRAKKGLYFNPERLESPYEIALRVHEGYIGLASALNFHGLGTYESFTVYVMTKNFRGRTRLEGTQYSIDFIPLGELFCGFGRKNNIYVSSVEKTLFDCFLRPSRVGFTNIARAVHDAEPDWRKFLGFFALTDNKSLRQRTGYLLRLLQRGAGKKIPDYVFKELHRGVKTPARLSASGTGSEYDREWKLQDNVGSGRILSWT